MITEDDAIKICLTAVRQRYETDKVKITNSQFDLDDKHWYFTFRVWDWLDATWRVWQDYEGNIRCAVYKE